MRLRLTMTSFSCHFLTFEDQFLVALDLKRGNHIMCLADAKRSLHSPVYSIWIPYGMGGFQPHSMDSIWTIFWLATQPFLHSIPTMESIWNPYGMDHSMDIPCASPCGFLVDSMEESTWKFCGKTINIVLSKIVSPSRIELSTP